jgi:hypothetical protein
MEALTVNNLNPLLDQQKTIYAVLEGGPADIPSSLRTLYRPPGEERKIKIMHRGGYEHFVRDEDSPEPVVFRWITRTEIAE